MHSAHFDGSFAGWRDTARALLRQGLAPHQVNWRGDGDRGGLFDQAPSPVNTTPAAEAPRIPRQLLALLQSAACFRVEDRWSLLYRILWRVAQGDRAAMLPGDIDGSQLHKRLKAVRREAHHLHATPDDGIYWDGQHLHYQRPCPDEWQRLAQTPEDNGQALWLAYYGSTFNPARLNRSALENSLPVRFWKNLPEGPLIPQLMSQARAGAQRDGQAAAVAQQAGKSIRRSAAKVPQVSENVDPDHPR